MRSSASITLPGDKSLMWWNNVPPYALSTVKRADSVRQLHGELSVVLVSLSFDPITSPLTVWNGTRINALSVLHSV